MTSASKRYEFLATMRSPYLERGRQSSKVTIPYILPPDGHGGFSKLPTPFNGAGADGVKNLSTKMRMAMLPPGHPFFRVTVPEEVLKELSGGDPRARAEIDASLVPFSNMILKRIEERDYGTLLFETLKHLAITGNCLWRIPIEGKLRLYSLNDYVVFRSPDGTVTEIIVKQEVHNSILNEQFPGVLEVKAKDTNDTTATTPVYTVSKRDSKGIYEWHQEVQDKVIPGIGGTYTEEAPFFLPLRWNTLSGEHYGRGICEEHIGDLRSAEALSKAIVEGSLAGSKFIFLAREDAGVTADQLSRADNLACMSGDFEKIGVVQTQKHQDLGVALQALGVIEQRLARAFVSLKSIQRDAERVTAEEVRLMANELEEGLGGVYSTLTRELQQKIIRREIQALRELEILKEFDQTFMEIKIITGLDALGRNHEITRLSTWLRLSAEAVGPEQVAATINTRALAQRYASNLGLDVSDIVKSEQQMQAEQQQAQQAQMLQQLGPEALRANSRGQQ